MLRAEANLLFTVSLGVYCITEVEFDKLCLLIATNLFGVTVLTFVYLININ